MQTEKGKEKVQVNPLTEDDLSGPLSGLHLKKKNIRRRIKRGKGNKKQLDALLEAITAQAKHVREMKATSSVEGDGEKWRKQAVMSEIFKLMELKYQYCSLSPVPITTPELFVATEPVHVIKIRWTVRQPDGKIKRLQVPFHDVTHITGQTVIDTIRAYTIKKNHFPKQSGFIKIEIAQSELVQVSSSGSVTTTDSTKAEKSSAAGGKTTPIYRAVLPTDQFCLPLRFPGPVLEALWIFNFRVTFPEKSTHLITPPVYKDCIRLPELIDTGVNLFSSPLCDSVDKVLNCAFGAGVSQMVLISTSPKNSKWSLEQCAKRDGSLYAMVGVHPYKATKVPIGEINTIRELAKDKYCVAIGECGLDRPRAERLVQRREEGPQEDKEEKCSTSNDADSPVNLEEALATQEKWLEEHIKLAIELNKPLFLHERGCFSQFVNIVSKYADQIKGRAVINCFTGTEEELRTYVGLGFYIAITGFVCNEARGLELRNIIKHIPTDKLLLGSDAPHLIPFSMPKPYPRHNEPAYLPHVASLVAESLDISLEHFASITTQNARKLFNLPVLAYDGLLRTALTEQAHSPNAIMGIATIPPPIIYVKKNQKGAATEGLGEQTESGTTATEEEKGQPVEQEGSLVFVYEGKRYECSSAKEKAILEKQVKLLAAVAFSELLQDFQLKEL